MSTGFRFRFLLGFTVVVATSPALLAQQATAKVDRGDIRLVVLERGTVEAVNRSELICRLRGSSAIKWMIEDGAVVKKGEKVLEFDDGRLREGLQAARIAAEQQRANLTTIEAELKNVELSMKRDLEIAAAYVKLAGLEREQMKKRSDSGLEKLKIHVEQTKTAVALAELNAKNKNDEESKLALQIARLEHEKAKLELAGASDGLSSVLVLKAEIALLEANRQQESARIQNEAKVQQAQQRVRAAQAQLKQRSAVVRDFEEQLASCILVAPQDGLVSYYVPAAEFPSNVVPAVGEMVREGQKLLTVNDLSQFAISIQVPESQIANFKKGQTAVARVDAIPNVEMTGKIDFVSTVPDRSPWGAQDEKRYRVRVLLDSQPKSLKPGMTAEVRFTGPEVQGVLRAPRSALLREGRQFVCQVKVGEKTARRIVQIGIADEKFVEIKSGLKENEEVILRK